MISHLSQLSKDQWTELIRYLGPDDLHALRLAGGRATGLADPRLTSHLPLRLDRAVFCCRDAPPCSEEYMRRWLEQRERIIIHDANVKLSADRLVAHSLLDSVTELRVYDCHRHRKMIEALSSLPNLTSLMLIDHGDQREALDELEGILCHVGKMHRLTTLDVEFDAVVHGSRLSFLRGLPDLVHLRLVGFDLSSGLSSLRGLAGLTTLHLCHGNLYSSPQEDAHEKDLMDLTGLTAVKNLHLEGFDELKGIGLCPFISSRLLRDLAFKHCQELNPECLAAISQMTHLTSLHFVMSSCDDVDVFHRDTLQLLNTLSVLKSLSLFYVLDAPTDIRAMLGLTSLEALNVAFEETLTNEEVEELCAHALHTFPSLKRLRIFSEDGMECSLKYDRLTVESASFSFGDLVYLD